MSASWSVANVVYWLHTALPVVLGIGVVAATFGTLRRYPRVAMIFWATLLLSILWQLLPSCILTDVEGWLRHTVDPEWVRTESVQKIVTRALTGVELREGVSTVLLATGVPVAVYAFWRYHRDQARETLRKLLRRS